MLSNVPKKKTEVNSKSNSQTVLCRHPFAVYWLWLLALMAFVCSEKFSHISCVSLVPPNYVLADLVDQSLPHYLTGALCSPFDLFFCVCVCCFLVTLLCFRVLASALL